MSKEQLEVFNKLGAFSPQFVLAGGTAIMLQIKHRRSFDFDCFTQNSRIIFRLLKKIETVLGKPKKIEVQTGDMILLKTQKDIDVSFVSYPFKPLQKTVKTTSLDLFHLDDLVANKAYTIGRHGDWRDYVDLFILLKDQKYSLEKIISFAEKKFDWMFNSKLFLQQLSYFGDLNISEIEFFNKTYSNNEIKKYLVQQTKSYFNSILNS